LQRIGLSRLILIIIGIVALAMGIMIFVYPSAVYPDPAHGFQVMRSMEMGGKFNMITSPDQSDISKNTSAFLSWWSPGQYLVPYFFKLLFGLNTGQASALTVTIFELSGLAGFYFFFKKIGFNANIIALSLLFIACQQAFVMPYVFYNGGEILLFGFEGWFLYGCLSIKKPGIPLLAFVLLSGWIGFICKSSFMWIYASGLLCIWLQLSAYDNKLNLQRLIKNGIWLFIPFATALATIYIFYLSKGINPASVSKGLDFSWQTFSFPLGAPLLAGLSVDDLAHGLIFHPVTPIFSQAYALTIVIILAILSVILVAAIMHYVPKKSYRLFLIVFYCMSILFFTVMFLRQQDISYESRHFRIIGLLITPGMIYLFSKFKPVYQVILGLICFCIAFANYAYFITSYKYNLNSARGNSGLAHGSIDQATLNYLMQLDSQNTNAIFVFLTPDISLEITHNRVATLEEPPYGVPFNYDDYNYTGHAGPIYMLLPTNYNGTKAAIVMKLFSGYSNFSTQKLSAAYTLYSAR